jgi:pantoate--beta-alanine ligase
MKILKTIIEVDFALKLQREKNISVGFVPTMGALHQGHISLVQKSKEENLVTIVSIFVNPTQFNDKTDLKNYPRTPELDLALIQECGVDYVFMPSEKEMYPEADNRIFDFGMLEKVMEGKHRPGHFNGVAQVVSKLFNIIKPTRAYFGQKDFQQLAIIRRMVEILELPVVVVSCPIVREPDGLAMSSRNLLLSPAHRKSSSLISKTLFDALNNTSSYSVEELINWVVATINKDPNLIVEYFEFANAITLEPISNWESAKSIVGCIAVKAGNIRLIDNIIFK